jgi:hypothetical protein
VRKKALSRVKHEVDARRDLQEPAACCTYQDLLLPKGALPKLASPSPLPHFNCGCEHLIHHDVVPLEASTPGTPEADRR